MSRQESAFVIMDDIQNYQRYYIIKWPINTVRLTLNCINTYKWK